MPRKDNSVEVESRFLFAWAGGGSGSHCKLYEESYWAGKNWIMMMVLQL